MLNYAWQKSVNFMRITITVIHLLIMDKVLIEEVSTAERYEEGNGDVACKIGSATGEHATHSYNLLNAWNECNKLVYSCIFWSLNKRKWAST
jgi:hypothetical protein